MATTAIRAEVHVYGYGTVPHGPLCCQCGRPHELVDLESLDPSEVIWSWVCGARRGQRSLLVWVADDRWEEPHRIRVCSEGCAIAAVDWLAASEQRSNTAFPLCKTHE